MSTTTAEAEAPETTRGDGPLLDLTDAAVKKFIKQAKARGYVTMDELNKVLPSEEVTSEQIEDTLAMLSEMGVNVVECEDDAEGGEVAVACTLGAELDLDGVARLDRGRLLGGELDGMAVVVISQDRIGRPQPHSPYALSGGGGKLRVLDQAFRRGAPALQLVELGLGVADSARGFWVCWVRSSMMAISARLTSCCARNRLVSPRSFSPSSAVISRCISRISRPVTTPPMVATSSRSEFVCSFTLSSNPA